MRHQYDIVGYACSDWIISECCIWCALAQEDKEVKVRGGKDDEQSAGNPGYIRNPQIIYPEPLGSVP